MQVTAQPPAQPSPALHNQLLFHLIMLVATGGRAVLQAVTGLAYVTHTAALFDEVSRPATTGTATTHPSGLHGWYPTAAPHTQRYAVQGRGKDASVGVGPGRAREGGKHSAPFVLLRKDPRGSRPGALGITALGTPSQGHWSVTPPTATARPPHLHRAHTCKLEMPSTPHPTGEVEGKGAEATLAHMMTLAEIITPPTRTSRNAARLQKGWRGKFP